MDLMSEILEMVADGSQAALVADRMCRRVEAIAPDVVCSILLIDDGRLKPVAAPSLPKSYSDALDGVPIGPDIGSCGTAAFLGKAVEVRDIANDPLWANFKHFVLPLGLLACWSSPIKSRDGSVLGTFAFYYRECRGPNDCERQIVERCTHLYALHIESVTQRQKVHDQAFMDSLSGLPNRASFDIRLAEMVSHTSPFALLFADLDHLKLINDTLGHAAGDELIRVVAKRLSAIDVDAEVFRLGGDEFAFILKDCTSQSRMERCAAALIDAVALPIDYFGTTLQPSLTAGGVLYDNADWDKNTLYQNADFALYHAKAVNRGGFVPFTEGMRTALTERFRVITQVNDALSEGRVEAFYQPLVRLDTAEIIGLEALARIKSLNGEILPASRFQNALTDPRSAYTLSSQMLEMVASDIRHWLDLGLPIQHVGFNVTTADLQKHDLKRRVTDTFSAKGVSLNHLILEVNEAVYLHDEEVAAEITSLRATGMKVALDDFGTGYASLTHLLEFPVDIIKIDKTFVDRIVVDPASAVIVQAVLDIASQMEMRVVAEGVETREQAERLLEMGCVLAQGHHFSPPVPATIVVDLLKGFAQRIDGGAGGDGTAAAERRLRLKAEFSRNSELGAHLGKPT